MFCSDRRRARAMRCSRRRVRARCADLYVLNYRSAKHSD
ncbi:hypothetical protein BURPS1710A_3233 [Burkholderia pseudomallei 1710a]|uniref:Uncharacterized protein n=1 Tax=Burkholderia pseudomallei 1710a TaxID=320371 RepID=A0A0E1W367_BURPE|nr:hypothetical protein BURPS1710A_3233 [Burkholderia pseudomallei 1710a]